MAQRRLINQLAPEQQGGDQGGGAGPIMRTPPAPPPAGPPPPGGPGLPGGDIMLDPGANPEADPDSRSGETGRERSQVTPRRPDMPSPVSGQAAPPAGVIPFPPMTGSSEIGISSPAQQGLFGGPGGLTGGGLGVPLDPHTNQQSPDIAGLLKMLMKGQGGV